MGNTRRNWYKLWAVDLAAHTATHETGLTVQFVDGLIFPKPLTGTHCMADGVGEWTGSVVGGDKAILAWATRRGIRDINAIQASTARHMEEAGRVFARAKADAAAK
ncbi:MAG: hypothetical protein LBE62_02420 [Azonexus sp.]|jgi:hypothetical protein|nr:hypothetical protein [Azonexus sp.]